MPSACGRHVNCGNDVALVSTPECPAISTNVLYANKTCKSKALNEHPGIRDTMDSAARLGTILDRMMSMGCCLFISEAILLAGTSETRNRTTCVVAAVFLHYFILAAFFWKNIMAYDIVTAVWRKRRDQPPKNPRRFVAFCLYGWFLPATIVGISIRLDQIPALHPFSPDYAHRWCWIANEESLVMVYLSPIALVLLSDLIMHIITVVDVCQMIKQHVLDLEPHRTDLMVNMKLFLLMGITWLIGYFGSISKAPAIWYIFSAFNAVLGVYMACIHVCSPAAWHDACHTLHGIGERIANEWRRFTRKRKKNTPMQRKRKPQPVDV